MMKFLPLFLASILLACACAPEETCEEDSISELLTGFKTESDGQVSDTTITDFTVYGIREGQTTWLLYDSATASEMLLPLDPHHDISRFVFQAGGNTDTLVIKHDVEIYLISYACGFGYQFTLDPDIQHGDGIFMKDSLMNPLVNTSLEEVNTHIWLYF